MSGLPIAQARDGAHGTVKLSGPTPVVAGMSGEWTVTYAAGPDGLAPGGAVALIRRWPSDWDTPQTDKPDKPGFTTIRVEPSRPHRWRTRRSID